MSAATEYVGALSPKAEAVLAKWELYSEVDRFSDQRACVRGGEDGLLITRVSREISAGDLEALLEYGRREFDRGHRAGVETAQANMRRALGIEQ